MIIPIPIYHREQATSCFLSSITEKKEPCIIYSSLPRSLTALLLLEKLKKVIPTTNKPMANNQLITERAQSKMSENITMSFSACKKQALMSMGWKKKNPLEYKCHWISICQRDCDAHKELLPINTSHLSQVDLWLSALNPVTFKRGNKKGFHRTIKHTQKNDSHFSRCVWQGGIRWRRTSLTWLQTILLSTKDFCTCCWICHFIQ